MTGGTGERDASDAEKAVVGRAYPKTRPGMVDRVWRDPTVDPGLRSTPASYGLKAGRHGNTQGHLHLAELG
jgi:hypothetical protein